MPHLGATPKVTPMDPPFENRGDSVVTLDSRGNLTDLRVIPPDTDKPSGADHAPDWDALFKAAGLDREKFSAVEPNRDYLAYADARAGAACLPEIIGMPWWAVICWWAACFPSSAWRSGITLYFPLRLLFGVPQLRPLISGDDSALYLLSGPRAVVVHICEMVPYSIPMTLVVGFVTFVFRILFKSTWAGIAVCTAIVVVAIGIGFGVQQSRLRYSSMVNQRLFTAWLGL
jgi:hypothetical protein